MVPFGTILPQICREDLLVLVFRKINGASGYIISEPIFTYIRDESSGTGSTAEVRLTGLTPGTLYTVKIQVLGANNERLEGMFRTSKSYSKCHFFLFFFLAARADL